MDYEELLRQAVLACENSYSPYSKFKVGAAAQSINGEIFVGCNIENVSFGLSMCAERIAVYNAISNGAEEIIAIAVFHDGSDMPYPCGACLQVISEFDENMQIIVANKIEEKVFTLKELMPLSFRSIEI